MTTDTMTALQEAQARKVHAEMDIDLSRPETIDALAAAEMAEVEALRRLADQIRRASAQRAA